MGLERLLRKTYGATPRIDLDKWVGQVRVVRPVTFDFAQLADGLKRNNVGVTSITVEATVSVRSGRVEIQGTGQSFPLEDPPPPDSGPSRRKLRVFGWESPAQTKLRIVP